MQRQREPELMDDPALDAAEHRLALQGLAAINDFILSSRLLWSQIKPLAQANRGVPLRVLDIATGSADVPLRMWQIAREEGFDLQVDGCDLSECAVQTARERAAELGSGSRFFTLDVLNEELPQGYDVVTTSLFAHHLSEDETVRLLSAMRKAAGKMVILVDLMRSQFNYTMIWIATRLLSNSRVVHFDGPVSVKNAYTKNELKQLIARAGYQGARLRRVFPARMMMVWMRPHER